MKTNSRKPRVIDPDNPPLTRAQLAKFRPAREVVPHIVDAYLRRRGRPPKGDAPKVQVTLRLDRDVIDFFKKSGDGWQTRLNDALSKAIEGKSTTATRTARQR
jgi:uncharacterized protein (DUF4415 family)